MILRIAILSLLIVSCSGAEQSSEDELRNRAANSQASYYPGGGGGYPPGGYPPIKCDFDWLPVYSDINLMSFSEITAYQSDVEGRVFGQGNITLNDYQVGLKVPTDLNSPVLVSNRSIYLDRVSIDNGSTIFSEEFIEYDSRRDSYAKREPDYFNFQLAMSRFISLAEYANRSNSNTQVETTATSLTINSAAASLNREGI